MKKIVLLIVGIVIGLSFTAQLRAEEATMAKEDKPFWWTLIILKNDMVDPDEGQSYHKQSTIIFWHYDGWLGGVLDVTVKSKFDYIQVKPYLTVNKGPLYLLGGVSTDSAGTDYIHSGIWYVDTLDKLSVFLDLRNYWGIDGEPVDYLDAFLELKHPIGEKFFYGLDLDYCHYWQDESHNFYFIGPYLGYQFTKSFAVFVRPSREWDVLEGVSSKTDKIRVGVEINF